MRRNVSDANVSSIGFICDDPDVNCSGRGGPRSPHILWCPWVP